MFSMNLAAAKIANFGKRAEAFVAQRPWRSALVLAPLVFVVLTLIFRPAYETNDDAAMSMIAAGKLIATTPDEHLVFTHPLIGLLLKVLYTAIPSAPWYGLYLLTTQIVAHTVLAGLLLGYCTPLRAMAWFACWMLTVGVYFITHLQFTSTAFLAGMAGVLLLWEVARRVCDQRAAAATNAAAEQASPSVLGLLVAGGALILWCEMIRWYMFYLIVMLPLPAVACWWLWRRPGWRITAQAAAVTAFIVAGGWGLKELHLAYYRADPEWRDFYAYNELRAQFNDTVKVVYNEQTRDSFEQAGWSAIDMQMMSSWCYEDTTVFSHEKLRKIWESRHWDTGERKRLKAVAAEMQPLLLEKPLQLCLFLLTVLTFVVPLDRRHVSFNTVVIATAVAAVVLLTLFQKTPPPRVYMPIMVWTIVAIAWNLLSRSLLLPHAQPELSLAQWLPKLATKPFSRGPRAYARARAFALVLPALALVMGLGMTIKEQHLYHKQRVSAQQLFRNELREFAPSADKLYVLWGASIPLENLAPLQSFTELQDLHLLWLGWPQQMPAHRAMKARYGITNLMREWPEHPEVVAICPLICTEFYTNYTKAHYGQDVRAVAAGSLMGNPLIRFQKAEDILLSEKPGTSTHAH